MASLASAVIMRITECVPLNLSNFAWSFARLAFKIGPLLDALSSEVIRQISAFNAQ